MKNKLLVFLIVTGALLTVSASLFGHHGTGISYDLTVPPVRMKVKIKELKWANPHIGIFFDAADDTGKMVEWSIEGNSPYNWMRGGWNRTTVKPGDEVTISFYRSKAKGVPAGVINKIIMPDGTEVFRFQRDAPGQEVR